MFWPKARHRNEAGEGKYAADILPHTEGGQQALRTSTLISQSVTVIAPQLEDVSELAVPEISRQFAYHAAVL